MKLKTKQLIFYILFVFVMLGVGLCYYNSYVNETFNGVKINCKDDCAKNAISGVDKKTCTKRCKNAPKPKKS